MVESSDTGGEEKGEKNCPEKVKELIFEGGRLDETRGVAKHSSKERCALLVILL